MIYCVFMQQKINVTSVYIYICMYIFLIEFFKSFVYIRVKFYRRLPKNIIKYSWSKQNFTFDKILKSTNA